MKNQIQLSITNVLREFGVVGVITYVGGLVILLGFLMEQDFQRQIIFGVIGLLLLFLSAYIAYFRIKIQRDRERALIDMVKSTNISLAEQIAKNLPEKQFYAVIQKIRQNQKDAIILINDNDKKGE